MPFIPGRIGPGDTFGFAADTVRAASRACRERHTVIGGAEPAGAHFGPVAVARMHEFVAHTLNADTAGVLVLSTLVTTENDRTKLRTKPKDIDEGANSPEYNDWLARYALLARGPALAARVRRPVNALGNGIFTDKHRESRATTAQVRFPGEHLQLSLQHDGPGAHRASPYVGTPFDRCQRTSGRSPYGQTIYRLL